MKGIALYIVTLYAVLTVAFYFLVELHAYKPPRATYRDTMDVIKLTTQSGARISAVYLPNEQSQYILLVSHGNADDLGTIMPFLRNLHAHGFSVFAYDYEGYGTSGGRPSERHVYEDEQAAYEYLVNTLDIPSNHIIAYGRSLGAAAAIDLATKQKVAGVVVEGGFTSVLRAVTYYPIFLFDRFKNLAKIKQVTVPLLVIHGRQDRNVPFYHGERLYEAANCPKDFLWVDEGGHSDAQLKAGDKYWEKLENITVMAALLDKVKRQTVVLQ